MIYVNDSHDEIKALGALKISATAKYVGQTILVTGIKDVPGLMALTGLSRATVYRAINDYYGVCAKSLTCLNRLTGENITNLIDGNITEKTVSLVSPVRLEDPNENVVYITTGATKESSTKILSLKKDSPPFVPQDLEKRLEFKNGRLQLFNQLKSYWVEKFDGDEQRLDLALVRAAGYVQQNSTRPLEAQVSAQLARDVSDKRDRDKRYASAISAKRCCSTPGKPTMAEVLAKRKASELVLAGAL